MFVEERLKVLDQEAPRIYIHKKVKDNVFFSATIFFLSNKFVEFQKNLFNEFISEILEYLEIENLYVDDFKQFFEEKLQEFNTKLSAFAEKLKNIDKIKIKGTLQIIIDEVYLNSLIGDISTLIFRENKLIYSVENEEEVGKIDLFSEMIEGELEDEDKIITVGTKIFEFLEDKDIEEIIEIARIEEKNIEDVLVETLSTRIDPKNIVFVHSLYVKIPKLEIKKQLVESKKNFLSALLSTRKIKDFIFRHKYPVAISLGFVIIILIIWGLINLLLSGGQNKDQIVVHTDNGTVAIKCLPEEIKKQIDTFQKIPTDSPQKTKTYNQILDQIKLCKQENLYVDELEQLQKILTKSYYAAFNIFIIDSWDNNKFAQLPQNIVTKLGNIFFLTNPNSFYIGGTSGALIGFISEQIPGKFVNLSSIQGIKGFNLNLLNNGLYTWTDNKIYNITKGGIENVIANNPFPKKIGHVFKYGNTNKLYINSEDEKDIQEGKLIYRYTNIIGYQTKFKGPDIYILKKELLEKLKNNFSSGFSDFKIDTINGTFLAWSKKDKKLYQLWRPTKNILNARVIPLLSNPPGLENLSDDVQIFVFGQKSLYGNRIYLYDRKNNQLLVYKSVGRKSNDANRYTYKLIYELSIDLTNLDVAAVNVKLERKPILYIIDKNGTLYKLDIGLFIDSLQK